MPCVGRDMTSRPGPGLGYRLAAVPDLLTEPEIRSLLGHVDRVGKTLVCLDEVDSTNNYAKSLAVSGAADGTVVVADGQTAGRGRMDRAFLSPKGKGIYLTALLRPDLPPERLDVRHAMAAWRCARRWKKCAVCGRASSGPMTLF